MLRGPETQAGKSKRLKTGSLLGSSAKWGSAERTGVGPRGWTGRTADAGQGQERQEGWDQGGKSVEIKEEINRRSNRKEKKNQWGVGGEWIWGIKPGMVNQ